MNINIGVTETEIKKQFRKLASIHHPDKNGGTKKSEETFKIILSAYETLSNRERRAVYDLKYKQFFQQTKSATTNQKDTKSNINQEQPKQSPPPKNGEDQKSEKKKSKIFYGFWIIVILMVLFYFYNSNKSTTTGPLKADEQQLENRPKSGEINFIK